MAQSKILGGGLENPEYLTLMGKNYNDVDAMRMSIRKLNDSKEIDIETMEYGQYQPILVPLKDWPKGSGDAWHTIVGRARRELTAQTNSTPLSRDQPDVVPLTRCALLDACVRKCFNSDPPIPISIGIGQQPMDSARADTHEILLVWEYDNGDASPPTRLNLKMMCPYRAMPIRFGKPRR